MYLWQRICFRAGGGIFAFVENIWWEMKSAASGATTENFLQISYHLGIVQIYDHSRVIYIFKIQSFDTCKRLRTFGSKQ